MNEPHLRSATAAGVVPAVAVDRLKTARREWHGRTYYGQITEGYVRWLGFSGCGKSIFRIARTSAANSLLCTAPKGASEFKELTASLKRCPDTKLEFSSTLQSRHRNRPVIAPVEP